MHFLKIPVFLGWILGILWSKVMNNYGIPKIHVFLHPEMFKFCVVGELSCWGLELKYRCRISFLSVTGKVQNSCEKNIFWAILRCVVDALSNLVQAGEQVRKHTCNYSFS